MTHLVIFMSDILHLEDFVLKGTQEVYKDLDKLYRRLSSINLTDSQQDVAKFKIDGSPAFVFGRLAGKTIVSTKSFFNKTPKYWTSIDEIMGAIMDNKLKLILIELYNAVDWSRVKDGTLWQGDWLKSCQDTNTVAFANVLHYETEVSHKTVVAIHTLYQETSDGELVEQKIVRAPVNLMHNTKVIDIWVPKVSSLATERVKELAETFDDCEFDYKSPKFYEELCSFLANLSSCGYSWTKIRREFILDHADKFWTQKYLAQYEKVKKRETQEHWHGFYEGIKKEFRDRFDSIDLIIRKCHQVKLAFIDVAEKWKTIDSWVEYSDGFKLIGFEGLVLYAGNTKVKLIERDKFSFWNRSPKYKKAFEHRRE